MMKKKLLSIFLTLLPILVSAETVFVDGFTFNVVPKGKYAEVTGCPSPGYKKNDLVVPEKVTYKDVDYPVTKICEGSLRSKLDIKHVTLPSTLTTIDKNVFGRCIYLESVNIPSSVTSIGEDAFYDCENLDVSISDIGAWCNISFSNLSSNPLYGADHIYLNGVEVKDLIIPDGVTKINDYAFCAAKDLSITIPQSVTSIGKYAFGGYFSSINIPNSVTTFSENAFAGCVLIGRVNVSDLETWCKISFPNQKSNPLNKALSLYVNGEKIEDLVIPNSITSIKENTFCGCRGIASVLIPNSVKTISKCAFQGCGMTSVVIQNGLETIGESAFQDCSDLNSVSIPNSVSSIEKDAFKNCKSLTALNISDLEAWCKISLLGLYSNPLYYAGHLYLNGDEIKDLVIPDNITSINNNVFYGCRGVISVSIPKSLKSIGYSAFTYCTGLTSVYITDLKAWIEIEFNGSNPLEYAGHLYLNGEEIKDLVIPNGIISIGKYAFAGCSGLTSIVLPKTIEYINSFVFEKCTGLTTLKIPESIKKIGFHAFYGCNNLTSVTIPQSVKTVISGAFGKCELLADVYCESEKISKDEHDSSGLYVYPDAFEGSDQEYITLHVPASSIDAYSAIDPWKNFKSIVPWKGLAISGDATGNGIVDEDDIKYVSNSIMNNNYDAKADVNQDDKVNAADLVYIINILKK